MCVDALKCLRVMLCKARYALIDILNPFLIYLQDSNRKTTPVLNKTG